MDHDWRKIIWREKNGEYQVGVICRDCPTACWLRPGGDPVKEPVVVSDAQWKWWHDMADGEPFRPWPEPGNSGPIPTVEIERLFK